MANPITFEKLFDKGSFDSGITSLVVLIGRISESIAEAERESAKLSSTLAAGLKKEIVALDAQSKTLSSDMSNVNQKFEQFKSTVSQTNDVIKKYEAENEKLKNKVKELTDQTKKYEEEQKKLNKTTKEGEITSKGLAQAFIGVASGAALIYKGISILKDQLNEAVKSTIAFEKAMKEVEAITRASANEIKLLTSDANRLGATTEKTATQIAGLQKELGKLGFNTTEILASTDAIVDLSTATGENLSGSATVAAATLRAFGLEATEMTRVVDVMAGSFVRSGLDLEKFRESMKLVAPIARATNVDIETTTAALSKLADAGLSGSLAGTALRNLLSNMADPTSKLATRLGFTVQTSEDLIKAFRQLKNEGVGLAEAVQLVDVRARPAFFTILNQIDAVEGLTLEYRSLNGEAADLADKMRDNLANDIEIATSAFDAMRRNIVEQFIPEMRSATQGVTTLAEAVRFLTRDLFENIHAFNEAAPVLQKTYGILQPLVDLWNKFSQVTSDYVALNQFNEQISNTTSLLSTISGDLENIDKFMDTFNKVKKMNVAKDFSELRTILEDLGVGYESILESLDEGKLKEESLAAQLQVRMETTLKSQKASIEQQRNSYEMTDREINRLEKKREKLKEIFKETDVIGSKEEELNAKKIDDISKELLTLKEKRRIIKEFLDKEGANELKLAELLKTVNQEIKVLKEDDLKLRKEALKLEFELTQSQIKAASAYIEANKKISLQEGNKARALLDSFVLYNIQKTLIEETYQNELKNIELSKDSVKDKLIKNRIAYNNYYAALQKLDSDWKVQQIKSNQETLKEVEKSLKAQFDANMKSLKNDRFIKDLEKRRKKREEDAKDEAKIEIERAKLLNQSIRAARDAFDTFFDYRKSQRQAEIDEITRWEQERIKLAGDNDEAIQAIRSEAERKRREIMNKNARDEKAAAMFNIALNTAQAIVAALKLTVGAIPLSIAIGAIGAAQLALVAAKPLPQFAKGTDNAPEGLAVVGEKGRELIYDKKSGTTTLSPDKSSVTYLSKGSVVIPNNITEQLLKQNNVDHNSLALRGVGQNKQNNVSGIDIKQLGNEFRSAVKDIPVSHTNFDEKGVKKFIVRGNNRTERLNRRYTY